MFSVSFPPIQIAEMKVKDGGSASGDMEEESRVCKNCKRDVAAVNFSLHEAHCMRFLVVCPKCEELVASKDMKEHLAKDHQKVRCMLCHQKMQQYLLEHHEAEECQERLVQCHFCELDLPFRILQSHLEACGSRTTMCWDCGKYIMYKAQEEHKLTCQTGNMLRSPDSKTNLCQQCNKWFPADEYLLHLNKCSSPPQLLGTLATHSATRSRSPPSPWRPPPPSPSSPTWKMKAEKDMHPKRMDRELSSLEKGSLRSLKSKKASSCQDFASILTSTGPQALNDTCDLLVACSQCNIFLPSPGLQKHEAEECQERLVQCHFCELDLPFRILQPHLEACGSRTTMCWDCGKYVMYKAQEEHKLICQTGNMLRSPAPAPSSPTWKMKAEKDVRPKRTDRELPSLKKASLRSPKSKKASSCQDFASILTSTGPHALNDTYDQLVACSQCNIFLPSPILQKHEKKCQIAAALQAIRESSQFLEKEGESMQSSPEGSSWQ